MPTVQFDGEDRTGGGVVVYTVAPEDYHPDMDEAEAEASSMRIGTYPPKRKDANMARFPDINIPSGTTVAALHLQPDHAHGDRDEGRRRMQGVILLEWENKPGWPYSVHSVADDGELHNGHYDITDRETALAVYSKKLVDRLYRYHNLKVPSVNYLRNADD